MILIYCGGGNPRFYEIAKGAGFEYGAQLPDTTYGPLYFADQDWRKPNRQTYMAELEKHNPVMATVLDWEEWDQLNEVLSWAEEAAQYVQRDVIIVPKVIGGIPHLPEVIGGKRVTLGYSVPTKYAGTPLPLWSFAGRSIHLLGGSPHKQMQVYLHLQPVAEVLTADGNMMNKMSFRGQLWSQKKGPKGHWTSVQGPVPGKVYLEAFRCSCVNIAAAWERIRK